MKGYDNGLKRDPMFVSKVIKGSLKGGQLYKLSLQVNHSALKVIHLLIGLINPPTKEGEVMFNGVTSKILTKVLSG